MRRSEIELKLSRVLTGIVLSSVIQTLDSLAGEVLDAWEPEITAPEDIIWRTQNAAGRIGDEVITRGGEVWFLSKKYGWSKLPGMSPYQRDLHLLLIGEPAVGAVRGGDAPAWLKTMQNAIKGGKVAEPRCDLCDNPAEMHWREATRCTAHATEEMLTAISEAKGGA